MTFVDHFSTNSADYARYRPDYPPALFAWLAGATSARRVAWDCGTGSGQAAVALAPHFAEVVGTDGSAAQLLAAERRTKVRYVCATAERSPLRDGAVDLVTVAQALHWFDVDAFYDQVNRVASADGVIAVWSYGPTTVSPEIDEVIDEFYHDTVGEYWSAGREHVENGYRDIPFPFTRIAAPSFDMSRRWTLAELLGYIGTWSAARRYRVANGDAGIERFAEKLSRCWGPPETRRDVGWPLTLRVGRVAAG